MKTKGKKHRGRGCLTALIILALIAAAAAFLIKDSRDDLEISRYEVKSQKLPESFDGFKIVQLSDLHGAEFGEDGMELVEKVKELEPDMIALTGDFVTDEGDRRKARCQAHGAVPGVFRQRKSRVRLGSCRQGPEHFGARRRKIFKQ